MPYSTMEQRCVSAECQPRPSQSTDDGGVSLELEDGHRSREPSPELSVEPEIETTCTGWRLIHRKPRLGVDCNCNLNQTESTATLVLRHDEQHTLDGLESFDIEFKISSVIRKIKHTEALSLTWTSRPRTLFEMDWESRSSTLDTHDSQLIIDRDLANTISNLKTAFIEAKDLFLGEHISTRLP